ncbi:hypothetical protein G6F66_015654 [Rhizopus arrhizus]|nr:hypothetical protein G6F66_015654 [Rhizopus arrhizus]
MARTVSGWSSMKRSLAVMAGTSRTGTIQPSTPSVTFSGSPPTSVTSAGSPKPMISRHAKESASRPGKRT